MNVNMVYPARRGRVIALHCSGASSQWCYLGEALGGRCELLARSTMAATAAGRRRAPTAPHADPRSDYGTGAVAVPIFQTTAYEFRSTKHAANLFGLRLRTAL